MNEKICGIKIISEKEMQDKLSKLEKERNFEKYGRDGNLIIGRKTFEYKGIKYDIAILRYYTLRPYIFGKISGNRITDMHTVVEYPKETKKLVDLIKEVDEYSEFLWHDTLHSWNDKQTIQMQIEECHDNARGDIDSLPEKIALIISKTDRLSEIKEAIKKFIEAKE